MVLAAQAHNNRKKRKEQKASKPNVLEAKTENQKNYFILKLRFDEPVFYFLFARGCAADGYAEHICICDRLSIFGERLSRLACG